MKNRVGLQLIEDIYYKNYDSTLINEILQYFICPEQFKISMPIDIINEVDFIFSSEKLILYNYLNDFYKEQKLANKPTFNFSEEFIPLYSLINFDTQINNKAFPFVF